MGVVEQISHYGIRRFIRARVFFAPFSLYRSLPEPVESSTSRRQWTTHTGDFTIYLDDNKFSIHRYGEKKFTDLDPVMSAQIGISLVQAGMWLNKQRNNPVNAIHDTDDSGFLRSRILAIPFKIYRRSPVIGQVIDDQELSPFWTTGYGGISVILKMGTLTLSTLTESIDGIEPDDAIALGMELIHSGVWWEKDSVKKKL